MKVFRIIPEFRVLKLTFHSKVSLKMLNSADNNSLSGLVQFILRYLTIFKNGQIP